MSKAVTSIILVALLCAPVVAQPAQPARSAEAKLSFVDVKDGEHPLIALGSRYLTRSTALPAGVKAGPEEADGNIVYFTASYGERRLLLALEGRGNRLFVDTDFDGSFVGEQPFSASGRGRSAIANVPLVVYGPIELKVVDGGETRIARVRVATTRLDSARVQPAGFVTGKVNIQTGEHDVALIDANLDGRYDSVFTAAAGHDFMGFDMNRDRSLDRDIYAAGEMAPLPRVVAVGGVYYSVDVAPDGSRITMTPVQPALGTLDAGFQGTSLVCWSDSGHHVLSAGRGSWRVPEGSFLVKRVTLEQRDAHGSRWTLTSNGAGNLGPVLVAADSTAPVAVGPPLLVKADARRSGGTVSFGMTLFGRAGEEYSGNLRVEGRMPPAPKIVIFDESGKTLASGQFAYG